MKKSIAILSVFLSSMILSCRDDVHFSIQSLAASEDEAIQGLIQKDSAAVNPGEGNGDPEPPRKDLSQWKGTRIND